MKKIIFLLLLISVFSISCRKDFGTTFSTGSLSFSKDTVFLDTVFTNIGSATYNLKIYNKSNENITIPKIELKNGTSSKYRLNVDGIPGKSFENIDILANDSIFVFVETTIDVNSITNPLYTDKILFDSGNNQQKVDLVTLVQDATFIFPGKNPITAKIDSLSLDGKPTNIKGRFLKNSELAFTKDKPYVIYGYAAVPANKTLTIEAGAKIHFHKNSGLIIDKKATLKVNGTLNEKVVFEGDRLEHSFSNTPGQWGTIWMRAGSKENEINYAQIKNGIIGILVDSVGSANKPTLTLKNTEIYNHSNFGVLGRETHITGSNLVIGSAAQTSLACTIGGTYNFTHCTFANFWNNRAHSLPAVLVNNFFTYKDNSGKEITETRNLQAANFTNCIIDGNGNVEFVLDKVDGGLFNYTVKNCMIRFNDTNKDYTNNQQLQFSDATHYQNILLNKKPHFRDTKLSDFIIGENSDAIDKANKNASLLFPLDILGVNRSNNPDIGAYQHITFK